MGADGKLVGVLDDISVDQTATTQYQIIAGFTNLSSSAVNPKNKDNTTVLVGAGANTITLPADTTLSTGVYGCWEIVYPEGDFTFKTSGNYDFNNKVSVLGGLSVDMSLAYYIDMPQAANFIDVMIILGQDISNNSIAFDGLSRANYKTTYAGTVVGLDLTKFGMEKIERLGVSFVGSTENFSAYYNISMELGFKDGWTLSLIGNTNTLGNVDISKLGVNISKKW